MSSELTRSGKPGVVGGILFILFTWLIGTPWHGWVAMHLWAWFVVPTFAVPPLSFLAACGLGLLGRLLERGPLPSQNRMDTRGQILVGVVGWPLLALLFGWAIWHLLPLG